MNAAKLTFSRLACVACLALGACCGCASAVSHPDPGSEARASAGSADASRTASSPAGTASSLPGASDAPPPARTGGFDGAAAYAQVSKLVGFGPRPPGSDAIRRAQDYIHSQLLAFGCTVEEDSFNARSPIGVLPMKNIVAKTAGSGPGIILLLTHYDTLRLANFVGAEDGGSSSGLMLEMARILCSRKGEKNAVWMAFLDGEEAQVVENGVAQWSDSDSVYGSRELAARMSLSGDLKSVRAVILADMVGQYDLEIERDTQSTPALTALIWRTANRLGYGKIFLDQTTSVDDDHGPFVKRGVPAVDLIDLGGYAYWHTPQDTMDKISAASLAVVGHVLLESVAELRKNGLAK